MYESIDIKSIISQELVKLLFNGHINVNTNISLSDIKPVNTDNSVIDNMDNIAIFFNTCILS